MGINWIVLLVLLVMLAAFVGAPTFLLVFGFRRFKRFHSLGAKVMIGIGAAIWLVYLSCLVAHIVAVSPYRSGIVACGKAPSGLEFCVVQTYHKLGFIFEPYQVSFFIRDASGVWRGSYLAHQDNAWRAVKVEFAEGKARVSDNGKPFHEIPMPTGTVDIVAVQQGEHRDDYLPAEFSAEQVLKWHNAKFR